MSTLVINLLSRRSKFEPQRLGVPCSLHVTPLYHRNSTTISMCILSPQTSPARVGSFSPWPSPTVSPWGAPNCVQDGDVCDDRVQNRARSAWDLDHADEVEEDFGPQLLDRLQTRCRISNVVWAETRMFLEKLWKDWSTETGSETCAGEWIHHLPHRNRNSPNFLVF